MNTYETDNKGTEYVGNYRTLDDGTEFLERSSYDEYETTYTDKGIKNVDVGEDKQYNALGILTEWKPRQSESFMGNRGEDSYAKSKGVRHKYDEETGEEIEPAQELTSETERKWENKTKENIKKLDITKENDEETYVNLMIGYTESDEKSNLGILEDISNYRDKEAQEIKGRTKKIFSYDQSNRLLQQISFNLIIPVEDEEEWRLNETIKNTYIGDFITPATSQTLRTTGTHLIENFIERKFDKYGRVIYEKTTYYTDEIEDSKTVSEYEYGKPVPLEKDREQMELKYF